MNFELIFCVVAVLGIALTIWSNADWYERCQKMNDEWYKRLIDVYKRIEELEAKLEDDGR